MRWIRPDSSELAEVRKGLEWAAQDLPAGRVTGEGIVSGAGGVRLALDEKAAGNGFKVKKEGRDFAVSASTPLGLASGVLNLAAALKEGKRPDLAVAPRFTSRFYKHEASITPGHGRHTWVGDLDEAFWVGYCKALVRNHFTGLTFYSHYHPFEFYLDYDEWPGVSSAPAEQRAKTLAGLKRAFGVARSFGLLTFMQHYVTHFPEGLAKSDKLHMDLPEVEDGRLAAFKHPVIDEYSRYIYRRTFELLPELSGFYLNFESSSNSGDFVRRCLFPEIRKLNREFNVLYRLWDFNALPQMVQLIKDTPCKARLGHKVQDRSDAYYYPKADPRVLEWKKALPDTEFTFLIGPCHNCATVQSSKMWADAEFVQKLLADMQEKGADSFSFHTVFELLAPEIDWQKMMPEREHDMALLNRGHLEAVVDYVRGVKTTPAIETKRMAERLGTDAKKASLVRKAVVDGSQVSLLWLQQHHITSAYDSYLRPGWFSTYQEPFFFLTMRCVNDDPWLPPSVETAWLNRSLKFKNIPEDVQLPVDYVNPKMKKTKRHPAKIAAMLEACAKNALAAAKKAAGDSPQGTMATLVEEATRNFHWGTREALEIRVAIHLCSIFFARTKAAAVGLMKKALAELRKVEEHVQKDDRLSARHVPLLEEARTEEDVAFLERLIAHAQETDFPYEAFAAYVNSHLAYGNIRRRVRGLRDVDEATEKFITKWLKQAVAEASKSVRLLEKKGLSALADNVKAWLDYVSVELKEVKTPSMDVKPLSQLGRDAGFIGMRHDQCFRYGENIIVDMDGFFTKTDFIRIEPVWFRLAASPDGLVVSLKEENVDVKQRLARWKQYRGSGSDKATEVLFFDRTGDGKRLEAFHVPAMGWGLFKNVLVWHGRQNMEVQEQVRVEGGRPEFSYTAASWRLDYTIPWGFLGGAPKPGEKWRFNIAVCPAVDRNRVSSWSQGYDMRLGKARRYGTITFSGA